jgi:transcriptional regulator GlxA family with amidase domain
MRAFKSGTGFAIGEYILSFRLSHAKLLLASTDLTLPFVTLKSGFGSERRLFNAFKRECSTTPTEYRKSFRRSR